MAHPAVDAQLWNVWNLPSLLTDHKSRERALSISPHLNLYDVVVLNETFVNKSALLSKSKHKWAYSPPRPSRRLLNSGLLFLSKHEIIDQGWEMYRSSAKIDRLAAKGIGFITVRVGNSDDNNDIVQVFGTHCQAGDSPATQVARQAQAAQAAKFINRRRIPEAVATVLAGDLNMGPRQHPDCETFSVHYTDRKDALGRCCAYERLVTTCNLQEVGCEKVAEYEGDVCRFLVRGSERWKSSSLMYEELHGPNGERLSDTKPMCLTANVLPKPGY